MIDTLKSILFSIAILVLLGIIGYWAVTSIQSGSEFKTDQEIEQLKKDNKDLTKQVADLTDELDAAQSQITNSAPVVVQDSTPNTTSIISTPTTTKTTTYKNQTLINQLQSLINSNVLMKLKSNGTRVGTIQNFLNIYNKTSNKVDNDYGASTKTAVASFQKDQGLNADGQAGPSTFSKMISWLKKQG